MAAIQYKNNGLQIINEKNEKFIVSEHPKGLLIEIIKEKTVGNINKINKSKAS